MASLYSVAVFLLALCCQLLNSKASQAMMPNDQPGIHGDEVDTWQKNYGGNNQGSEWSHGMEEWSAKKFNNQGYASGRGGLVDDEDNDEYSASGSGYDGIKEHPYKATHHGNSDSNDDITFDSPYVTPKSDMHGNAPEHTSVIVLSITTILSLIFWING